MSNNEHWEYEEGGDQDLTADKKSFDSDSAYEDGGVSEVATAFASEHRYENGRRYHKYHEGQYLFPNDEQENERLDLEHHIACLAFGGKLHFSPIRTGEGDPAPILDVGFGSGIWAVSMAEIYPTSDVIGTDLSWTKPIWSPPNCRFEIDDCELDWMFKDDYFEFVHLRYLNGSIKDWPRLFQQSLRHTRPGGWIELQESDVEVYCDDNTLSPDNPMVEWFALMNKAATSAGRPFEDCRRYKGMLTEAGYQNIEEKVFKVPFNGWPKDEKMKEMGRYQVLNISQGLEGWSMALFTRVLGWERDDVINYLAKIRNEFKNRKVHAYWKVRVTWGQKVTSQS